MSEEHLKVYKNRSVLHSEEGVSTFDEGKQSEEAKKRYEILIQAFEDGFYSKAMSDISVVLLREDLISEQKTLIKSLVDGVTSNVGRGLVNLCCLQFAIKSITPSQSIRLHKGSPMKNNFSWIEGISMRKLDSSYNTPFLRDYSLLNMNKDGGMMTRTLAENYPYSRLYKAEIRGPAEQWVSIVEALENGSLPPYPALCFLLSLLKNRSDTFTQKVGRLVEKTQRLSNLTMQKVKNTLVLFFTTTTYSARAFEVVLHALIQALVEMELEDEFLVPLSQMRSANKKHGNIGDIELKQGDMIIESWDAKYGKPYLRDELEELHDKLNHHPNVEVAGFIVNSDVNKAEDIMNRVDEISTLHDCEILLLSFEEWLNVKVDGLTADELNKLAKHWLIAVVESFGQKRLEIAPIDEPCDQWIEDLSKALNFIAK
jgi:hypothetical protein